MAATRSKNEVQSDRAHALRERMCLGWALAESRQRTQFFLQSMRAELLQAGRFEAVSHFDEMHLIISIDVDLRSAAQELDSICTRLVERALVTKKQSQRLARLIRGLRSHLAESARKYGSVRHVPPPSATQERNVAAVPPTPTPKVISLARARQPRLAPRSTAIPATAVSAPVRPRPAT